MNEVGWREALERVETPWQEGVPLFHGDPEAGLPGSPPSGEGGAASLAEALLDFTTSARVDADALRRLDGQLRGCDLELELDEVLARVASSPRVDPSNLAATAAWICTRTTDIVWARLGLGLLALVTGLEADAVVEWASRLGRYPALRMFAALALRELGPQGEPALWRLARTADGWERAWLASQLRGSVDPELRRWVLEEAFDSGGGAVAALELLRVARPHELARDALASGGLAQMLEALLIGDEDVDIDDYEEAAPVVEGFVEVLDERVEAGRGALSLIEVSVLARVDAMLREGDALAAEAAEAGIEVDAAYLWQERARVAGWTQARRRSIHLRVERLRTRAEVVAAVRGALVGAADREDFERALLGADYSGLQARAAIETRLRSDPSWAELWQRLLLESQDLATSLAAELLPLAAIASGPALRYDFDEGTVLHDILAELVQASASEEAPTWSLWGAALRSPLVRVRAAAVEALIARRAMYPDRAEGSELELEALAKAEPDEELAASLAGLAADRG